jgi:Bacteriocin-protection, YdeI or OmpD-Associated/Domain of unknown function (DUF1905)
MMRHVDVPEETVRQLAREMAKGDRPPKQAAKRNYIPVVAKVNGQSARATLVPASGGRFRMQINMALRRAARVDAGDMVSLELRLDRGSRNLPVPSDLRAGLKQHPKAEKEFRALPPGHRRQFIHWFDSAKSAEARRRRLERAIDHLLERAMLRISRRHRHR